MSALISLFAECAMRSTSIGNVKATGRLINLRCPADGRCQCFIVRRQVSYRLIDPEEWNAGWPGREPNQKPGIVAHDDSRCNQALSHIL